MYKIYNRRYTGSKYKLLDDIEKVISKHCKGEIFLDVFAGTGVVSDRMRHMFSQIIMNDFLYSNEVIYKAFFGKCEFDYDFIKKKKQEYSEFRNKEMIDNYFSSNFGGKYFSEKDAGIIGAIRDDIEAEKSRMNEREYSILLASLLYSMDKVANTVGHYDAYRKKVHIEDRFKFDLIEASNQKSNVTIFREDANSLVKRIEADVAFIDPPYNSRQYSRFYHILENVTKWEKPELTGTALKPPIENMSEYCRSSAPKAFEDLIDNIRAKYIIVTYNNTYDSKSSSSRNKITLEEIAAILNNKGNTMCIEKEHSFFNAGKTDFKDHKEYIFVTEVK